MRGIKIKKKIHRRTNSENERLLLPPSTPTIQLYKHDNGKNMMHSGFFRKKYSFNPVSTGNLSISSIRAPSPKFFFNNHSNTEIPSRSITDFDNNRKKKNEGLFRINAKKRIYVRKIKIKPVSQTLAHSPVNRIKSIQSSLVSHESKKPTIQRVIIRRKIKTIKQKEQYISLDNSLVGLHETEYGNRSRAHSKTYTSSTQDTLLSNMARTSALVASIRGSQIVSSIENRVSQYKSTNLDIREEIPSEDEKTEESIISTLSSVRGKLCLLPPKFGEAVYKRYDNEQQASIISNNPIEEGDFHPNTKLPSVRRSLLDTSIINLKKYMRDRNSDLVKIQSSSFLMDSIKEKSNIWMDEENVDSSEELNLLLVKLRLMLKVELNYRENMRLLPALKLPNQQLKSTYYDVIYEDRNEIELTFFEF